MNWMQGYAVGVVVIHAHRARIRVRVMVHDASERVKGRLCLIVVVVERRVQ